MVNSLSFSRNDATPIGSIEVLATPAGVFSVNLLGHVSLLAQAQAIRPAASELTEMAMQQILAYLAKEQHSFTVKLDLAALNPFQKAVLSRTQVIPFGEVMTYGQLAKELGKASASRAVGGALGHNPLPILIPCHRVVASDGRLTGYSAAEGIQTKKWLLELEGYKVVGEKLA